MNSDEDTGLFFIKPPEMVIGRVRLAPEGPEPYRVVFRLGDQVIAEHPVPTIREGEALIRREMPGIQFSAMQQRPHPEAPKWRLEAVPSDTTD
ncbi:hypothetical protein HJG53_06485 [Sphingomonas sp. ID1715]|uniref:hypothetical protein n=1 Tax=Sphingomonas sp. ID1715 TaxID=1656898 RepID=UPI001488791A|nr:hypothetical protein [Sphingomonas sp. ID1715]NNM76548.1 hypothetical protein [Sphingomonas sp. ID1715]